MQNKISENVTCEIMQVIVQQAQESYATEVVVELDSNTEDQCAANIESLLAQVQAWSPASTRGGGRQAGGGRYDPY